MMTPAERVRRITQLQAAINRLPTFTADVVVEDSAGNTYELVRSFPVGGATDDPGLVLKIRRLPAQDDR